MARPEHRTKTYLKKAIFQFVEGLNAEFLGFTHDFVVESFLYDRNTRRITVREPSGQKFRYDLKLVEKL